MGKLSRRGFLMGSAAAVTAATTARVPVLPEAKLFSGYVVEYNGIIIRMLPGNIPKRRGYEFFMPARQVGKLSAVLRSRPWPPVYLPPALYDDAERMGFDLRGYERQQPMPRSEEPIYGRG